MEIYLRKKVGYLLFLILSSNYFFCQDGSSSNLIDSIEISHMPLNSRGSFMLSETEFRNTYSHLKGVITIKDSSVTNNLYETIVHGKENVNKKTLSILVIFDFYIGNTCKTILMDCAGIITFSSSPNTFFYAKELNEFFKKLTNQENVICGW